MATRKTKFKVSIKELSFEFEGSQEIAQEVQQGLQQTLGGLLSTQARVLAYNEDIPPVIASKPLDHIGVDGNGNFKSSAVELEGEKPKQPRQRRTKGGPTVADLLNCLKQEAFFSEPRTGREVLARLKDKGQNPRPTSVLTGLQVMTKNDELFREYNGENVYVYKDRPFNERPRSPSPGDQPSQ